MRKGRLLGDIFVKVRVIYAGIVMTQDVFFPTQLPYWAIKFAAFLSPRFFLDKQKSKISLKKVLTELRT